MQSFTVKISVRYAVNAVTAVHIMMISSVLSFAIARSHCFRDHCCHYRHHAHYRIHSSSLKSYCHKTLLWLTYFVTISCTNAGLLYVSISDLCEPFQLNCKQGRIYVWEFGEPNAANLTWNLMRLCVTCLRDP